MNIVIMVDALHSIAAGSERQIYKLASGLVERGHAVKLVLLRHTAFTESLTDFPCTITSLGIPKLARWQTVSKMIHLRGQLIRENVDAIHAWLPECCLLAPAFLKHPKLTVITSRRDMGLIYQGKPAWLFKAVRSRTDAVVANSQAVAKHVTLQERLLGAQCKVIYNGLDTFNSNENPAEQAPIFNSADAIKLILVANVKPVKRTLDAVKAVTLLNSQGILVELALAGEPQDANYVAAIKNHLAANQAEKQVHWLGSVREPRRLLPQADIGLLVSDSEGLSNTLMEYMQAGLPAIATNVGGNPELIEHEVTGLLVEKGRVEAIADAILQLHRSPALRESCKTNSQQRINTEFSVDNMINQHLALYGASHSATQGVKAPC
ncbi:glycosyltransferase [Simiduia sp. 21SJ11W-1]|uniref:glycosyltransferase n=1 Tax=Simiduia sp. 21SJ11W-1 TaxID=2909669 RepID=UPI00209D7187|nr:glycosyltransferase [Simiduia sp. 21SJ11W-1]UTA47361.1 glycosyltransferase [Simiduia sp. 21SJ11W-1]